MGNGIKVLGRIEIGQGRRTAQVQHLLEYAVGVNELPQGPIGKAGLVLPPKLGRVAAGVEGGLPRCALGQARHPEPRVDGLKQYSRLTDRSIAQ